MKLLQKKIKNNLNTELTDMGVFSAVAGNQLPNQLQKKSTTGSLPPAVPLAIKPTFSPWTHTSDDSYIYQLSLVLATATVSSTDNAPLFRIKGKQQQYVFRRTWSNLLALTAKPEFEGTVIE